MIKFFALSAAALAAPAIAQSTPGDDAAGSITRAPRQAGISAGLEYQEGDFGTGHRIETISVPLSAYASTGRLQFSASLPYLRVDAPGNVIGGGTGVLGLPIIVDPTQPPTRERREGLGDLRVNASYTIPVGRSALALWNQVKLPTASAAKGLGTGATDYSFGAEVAAPLGRLTPFASIGYTLVGDTKDYDLRNSLSARAGANLRLGQRVAGRISYTYAQSPSPELGAEQVVSTALHTEIGRSLSLGIYGSTGLSETAADLGAGIQLGLKL
jgi:hypothetical protein